MSPLQKYLPKKPWKEAANKVEVTSYRYKFEEISCVYGLKLAFLYVWLFKSKLWRISCRIQCGANFRGDIKLCKLNMHFNLLEVSFILQKFTVIYSVSFIVKSHNEFLFPYAGTVWI